MTPEQIAELQKCKDNPYYFMTTYWKVDGKSFTTHLTEEEFNKQFKQMQNEQYPRFRCRRQH